MGQKPRFFDVDERPCELSAKGDALERIAGLVDFEMFRPELEGSAPRSDGSKGGRFHALLLVQGRGFATVVNQAATAQPSSPRRRSARQSAVAYHGSSRNVVGSTSERTMGSA
jgi:hypothetical protein